ALRNPPRLLRHGTPGDQSAVPTRVLKASRLVSNAWIIVIVGLGFVLAAAIAVAVLIFRSDQADYWVSHTFEVQQVAESLIAELSAAESGQRAYILTRNPEYLVPVDNAVAMVPDLIAKLKMETADNEMQQERLGRVEPLVASRLQVIKRSIDLVKQGNSEAA